MQKIKILNTIMNEYLSTQTYRNVGSRNATELLRSNCEGLPISDGIEDSKESVLARSSALDLYMYVLLSS